MASAILPMKIDGLRVAVRADRVVEVISEREFTPLAGATARAPGVVTWRERAVAAVDVGALLGAAPTLRPGERRRRIAVLKVGTCTAAVPVDEVQDVVELAAEAESEARALGMAMLDDALEALVRELGP